MTSNLKGPALLFFIILAIISFIFAIGSNTKANENKKLFETEMAYRLDIEEKISKLRNENIDLVSTLKNKDLDIQQKAKLINELNQALIDKDKEIESLQSELRTITLSQEQLESELKQAQTSQQQ